MLVVADEPLIERPRAISSSSARTSQSVEADLSTIDGVDTLLASGGRAADRRAVRQCRARAPAARSSIRRSQTWRHAVDTNITGTVYLLQRVLADMVARDDGKILVTGSIAGYIPGSFNAVYNATKAFVDNFTEALRNEIKESKGVTLTTLMPGPTDTEFFARADMLDTQVGQDENKADPAKVAQDGWDAMMAGKGHIVSGWKNKLQVAGGRRRPAIRARGAASRMAEPGSGEAELGRRQILGDGIGQAGAVEDARGLVAHARHRDADRAARLALAIGAAAVRGAADARDERQRPLDHADDLAQRNQVRRARQAISAHLAAMAVDEPGLAQIGEDQFEEFARHVGAVGDAVHRDRRPARGRFGQIEHRAERVTGTLRQHSAILYLRDNVAQGRRSGVFWRSGLRQRAAPAHSPTRRAVADGRREGEWAGARHA